jgi:hypothetical protein
MSRSKPLQIGSSTVRRGERRDIKLVVSQNYTGDTISLPIHVIRAKDAGPTLFVTAVVHGDELNGLGIVHELMFSEPLRLERGTLVLVPVVNVFGFETQDRYMSDRRDLNRTFPGSATGSLTARLADIVFTQIVRQADYGIDLHSAATPRTNFPNVRGELASPQVRRLAKAFGCELMISSKGPQGSLRREACKAGVPTIILEAGEPLKMEPSVLEVGVRGIKNVLKELGMMPGEQDRPPFQFRVERSTWVRAEVGGILRFHISPGDPVETGQPVATNSSVFGRQQNVLRSPVDGIVLGVTTLPTVKPGEPVCHIAVSRRSLRAARRALAQVPQDNLHRRLRHDLATSILVSDLEEGWADNEPVRDEG